MSDPQKTSLFHNYYACICFPYSWSEVSMFPVSYYSVYLHSIFPFKSHTLIPSNTFLIFYITCIICPKTKSEKYAG